MSEIDVEEWVDSDGSGDEEQHSRLLSSVSQLDSTQRVKPASRKEIISEASEYNLIKGTSNNKNLVNIKELAQVLGAKTQLGLIEKKVNRVTGKRKTLPKPLEKNTEERLKRFLGFVKVKNQLKRWDAIVSRNALKDNLKFPLTNNTMKMQRSNDFLNQFKKASPLELEISKILQQDGKDDKEESVDETFPLTLEEMMEKRKEMAQLRAKLSYKEAKAQRQSKIKSKKYHRILRREKLKQQLKEFELLQKSDPEAALKKLAELDKSRAQERASLRHRNTGQWAKNMKVRAKYDIESRKILAEQLKMSREITQKVKNIDSSDEDEFKADSFIPAEFKGDSIDKENPWAIKISEEMESYVSGYKKYWEEQNKKLLENNQSTHQLDQKEQTDNQRKEKNNDILLNECEQETNNLKGNFCGRQKNERESQKTVENVNVIVPESQTKICGTSVDIQPTSGVWIVSSVSEDESEQSASKKPKLNDIDCLFDELNDQMLRSAEKKVKSIKSKLKKSEKKKKKNPKKTVENEKFELSLRKRNEMERPDLDVELMEGEENELEVPLPKPLMPSTNNKDIDCPAEVDPKNFIQVKPKKLHSQLPDDINEGDEGLDDERLQLSAMEEAFGDDDVGSEFRKLKEEEEKASEVIIETSLPGWGQWGGTGIKSNDRKKRRLILKLPSRKDKKKVDTIINENENPKLKNHLVKEVPHPFKSVEAFEANIRAPIGRDWMPETAHRTLIQKQVETKLGAVIEPMSEEEILREKKKVQSPYEGKKKKWTNN